MLTAQEQRIARILKVAHPGFNEDWLERQIKTKEIKIDESNPLGSIQEIVKKYKEGKAKDEERYEIYVPWQKFYSRIIILAEHKQIKFSEDALRHLMGKAQYLSYIKSKEPLSFHAGIFSRSEEILQQVGDQGLERLAQSEFGKSLIAKAGIKTRRQ